jgi:hypothetical protein
MVQRVVYNACFGGFGFHEEAVQWVRQNEDKLKDEYDEEDVAEIADSTLSGETYSDGSGPKQDYINYITDTDVSRDNELLADIVSHETEYTGQYNGDHSKLQVAEVPDNIEWALERYDGQETVKEATQTFS